MIIWFYWCQKFKLLQEEEIHIIMFNQKNVHLVMQIFMLADKI